jgi:nucleotide-binding universal stress UspA family protein
MAEQGHEDGDRIVVGVDGSDSSKEALAWAVRQAALTGAVVDAVTAWQIPSYNAARALLDAAKGAGLLVVGSRGHAGFTEALLGSVGQYCVHHAECPVVVVPHRPPAH